MVVRRDPQALEQQALRGGGTLEVDAAESKNLKPKTINNVLAAGTVALRWAAENELIGSNPAAGLVTFSGTAGRHNPAPP